MKRTRFLGVALVAIPVLVACGSASEDSAGSGVTMSGSGSGFAGDAAALTGESTGTLTSALSAGSCADGPVEVEPNDTDATATAFDASKTSVCGSLNVSASKAQDVDYLVFDIAENATGLGISYGWSAMQMPSAGSLSFKWKAVDKAGAPYGSGEMELAQLSTIDLNKVRGGKMFVIVRGTTETLNYTVTRKVTVANGNPPPSPTPSSSTTPPPSPTPSSSTTPPSPTPPSTNPSDSFCTDATKEVEDNGSEASATAMTKLSACGQIATAADVDNFVIDVPATATGWSSNWRTNKAGLSVVTKMDWPNRKLRFTVTGAASGSDYRVNAIFK